LFGRIFRLLVDQRADRHFEVDVVGILARTVGTFAMTTAFRAELAVESECDEGVDMWAGDSVDGPALASVAAVRSAAGDELLAPEAHGAGAAVPGLYEDVDFVDEHEGGGKVKGERVTFPLLSRVYHHRQDADSASPGAVVFKTHAARDLREESVVLAEADVDARRETATALAHQNRSTGHDVAVVALHAEALRIAVAAVA